MRGIHSLRDKTCIFIQKSAKVLALLKKPWYNGGSIKAEAR
jgi:hypothetical protein